MKERGEKAVEKGTVAYPSSILKDGQDQALFVRKRYQSVRFFGRPGKRLLDDNYTAQLAPWTYYSRCGL